jgi:hypothetical protein
MSAYPTCAQFAQQIGTKFLTRVGEQEVELVLVSAEPGVESAAYESFSLHFEAPSGRVLDQATYPLTHGAFGELPIFLVPIGPNRYEAVFNVAKESEA